jgi:prepilin-type N-terminal cleavage/methylation domain-containing protein
MIKKGNRGKKSGFTLVEVLVAVSITAVCLAGMLLSYINLLTLTDLTRDFTLATSAASQKVEEVKRSPFDSVAEYNNTVFSIAGFPAATEAKGRIEITNTTYSYLKKVRITVAFRTRGRVIGEDTNLNGRLDEGENTASYSESGAERLDSPVEVVTYIGNYTL